MAVSPDSVQTALESQVDVLARWLVVFTGLVVLGLLMEYGAEFAKWRTQEHIRNPRLFLWVPIWAFIGGILIVGGVAGELYVEFFASRAENNLRELSDSVNAVLKKQAGDAEEHAARLEQQMADRHITLEQRKKMLEILKVRPGANITIWYVTDSGADTLAYTLEIQDVFQDAGWHVFHQPNLISYETPLHGFLVEVRDLPSNRQLANLAAKALAVTGYQVSPPKSIPPEPNQDTAIIVLVGSK